MKALYLVVTSWRSRGVAASPQARVVRTIRLLLAVTYLLVGAAFTILTFHHLREPHPHTDLELVEHLAFVLLTVMLVIVLDRGFRTVTRTEAPRRVLVVGAHPDDLELACGGTVASLVHRGHTVKVLVMSQGMQGGDPAARRGEAMAGAALLGTRDVTVHDFPDTRLSEANGAMIAVIEKVINDFEPGTILTHSEHDQHQDHQAVHRAVLRAGRQAHSILCFESPSVTRSFSPSVFVDISDFVDLKVRAVQTHRDQSGKPYMTAGRVKGIAAFRGAQAKVAAAEGFEPVRYLQNIKEQIG